MNNIIIRKATMLDAKDMLNINVEAWKKTYNNIFPKEFLANLDNNYEESIKKMKKRIQAGKSLVAELNGVVLGFCNYGISRKEQFTDYGEIYALYIKNNYLGQGIGTKLFISALNNLKEDYSKNIVSCLKDNSSNIFYTKMGCKKIGECDFILNGVDYKENIYEI